MAVWSSPADAHPANNLAPASSASPIATVMRGAMALISAQPITWAASLLTAAFLPHLLGDTDFGKLAIAMTVAGLAGTVASVGVPNLLPRWVATDPSHADAVGTAAMIVLVGLTIIVALSIGMLTTFVSVVSLDPIILRLALAGMVGSVAQTVAFSILNGRGQHGSFAWINAAAVAACACAGIGVLLLGQGLGAYLLTMIIINLIVAALAWRIAGITFRREALDPKLWRRLILGGLPFLGWEAARRIRAEVDVVVIGLLLRAQVAGWLAAAYRIISIPVFIPTLITTPLLPALSRSVANETVFRATLRRSIVTVLALSLPASGMIFSLAPAVPDLLHWGSGFDAAVPVMMILAFQQPLVALDVVLGTALFALKQERRWLCAMAVAATFNPALNLAIIPLAENGLGNGAIGAAGVELATEVVVFVGACILLPRDWLNKHTAGLILRLVAATIALVAVAFVLQPLSVALAVVVGQAVYLGAVVALRVVRPSDAQWLYGEARQLLARRPAAVA